MGAWKKARTKRVVQTRGIHPKLVNVDNLCRALHHAQCIANPNTGRELRETWVRLHGESVRKTLAILSDTLVGWRYGQE